MTVTNFLGHYAANRNINFSTAILIIAASFLKVYKKKYPFIYNLNSIKIYISKKFFEDHSFLQNYRVFFLFNFT